MPLTYAGESSIPALHSNQQNAPLRALPKRQQSQHSELARSTLINKVSGASRQADAPGDVVPTPRSDADTASSLENGIMLRPPGPPTQSAMYVYLNTISLLKLIHVSRMAASDTPLPTAPSSPDILPGNHQQPRRQGSGDSINRTRATTLDIPGLTKSKVSPDGKISSRDIGSKLVIVMVGLPARGKSYITKKMARYLNWLQHDTKIFNVGERRRVAAGSTASQNSVARLPTSVDIIRKSLGSSLPATNGDTRTSASAAAARMLIADNSHAQKSPIGDTTITTPSRDCNSRGGSQMPELYLPDPSTPPESNQKVLTAQAIDQSASFFDPNNRKAALIREQAALDALDDLLDYLLEKGGSVGILDATNSTLERRKLVMERIRDRAGPNLNVLFMESLCVDEELLERNMRLKLSGPDYKGKDPEASLADFKKRVAIYEQNYKPLGDYEEKNNMPYVQMIDVGRKVVSHQIKGFLSSQAVYYLLNFNLAPRQIWVTRHGESSDNCSGKIGGDAPLSPMGYRYAQALTKFINFQRKEWGIHEQHKVESAHMPPEPGDRTPPNPHYECDQSEFTKNFCVWTSMLQRSVQTAQYFDEEEYDTKQMRMLNELYAGQLEGMTYAQIRDIYPHEYASRVMDKLHYRYPGPGGEGYLDVINRVRAVIVELERMTDHCLLISHRSVVRVLLAYFTGLSRDKVTDLDVPIGMLYCLEPKPYGVDMRAYKYDVDDEWFQQQPNYELRSTKADPA